ncbi:hypothetical protein HYH02_006011 [Chlamydomonas schloesseri]|uniref:START domain-containing protein n=1 Tax=Chlamydomonas schloesseri TaxID=2026947 RepID=A0A835WK04_9CHLO|nr:hypothetical protein HYH02_006011 [Chlamydomonas schloesseri]|eukprot:KAG2448654.1 hypothetical protein HYH02_006011 [Chlamydomonas schloesseri]
MTSEAEKLYSTGADILASARARGLPLEGGDLGNGWEPHNADAPDGGQYASRLDDKSQTYAFVAVREFSCTPLQFLCYVRDFDLGKLAGELKHFKVLSSTPELQRVEYVSVLPWPFEPRWALADMRFGVVKETGALIVLGESVPDTTPPAGHTLGTVLYSYYHISPHPSGDANRCVVRRAINVDMHLPLPGFVVRKSLAAHYYADMGLVDKDLEPATWQASGLAKRLADGPAYAAIAAAAAAAKS